jgi:hypothetical protein
MIACPSVEQLLRLLDDRLDEAEAASIVDHVEDCARCQEQLEELTSRGHSLFRWPLSGVAPEPVPDPDRLPSTARDGSLQDGSIPPSPPTAVATDPPIEAPADALTLDPDATRVKPVTDFGRMAGAEQEIEHLARGSATALYVGKDSNTGAWIVAEPERVPAATSAEWPQAAEADYRTALVLLDQKPNDELRYEVLVNRGLLATQRRNWDRAVADLDAAIRLNPRRFPAFAALAEVFQQQDQPDRAVEQFSRAIELRPDWAPLYRGRADVDLKRKALTPASARGPCATWSGPSSLSRRATPCWRATTPTGASSCIAPTASRRPWRRATPR